MFVKTQNKIMAGIKHPHNEAVKNLESLKLALANAISKLVEKTTSKPCTNSKNSFNHKVKI